MTTPAKRRFEQVVAATESAAADPHGSMAGATAYELMLVKLASDKRRLKDIQSISTKVEVKREVLPDYDTWVDGVLESGAGANDEVLVTVMIWNIDVGNFEEALRIGSYALRHNLVLPDVYQRNVATVIVDEIADAALIAQKSDKRFPLQMLQETAALTDSHDMPDEARAKLYRALGIEYQEEGDTDAALLALRKALGLNPKVGVKTIINKLEAELKQTKQAS